MPESPESSGNAKDANTQSSLDRIARLGAVTAIAPLSIAISFFYDWGFFFALGISFEEAPTTISDHIQSWFVWLPAIVPSALIMLAMQLLNIRIEGGMTEHEINESSSNPDLARRFRYSALILMGFTGVPIPVLWLLFGSRFSPGLIFALPVCWFMFVVWVFSLQRVRSVIPDTPQLFFSFPLFRCSSFSWVNRLPVVSMRAFLLPTISI